MNSLIGPKISKAFSWDMYYLFVYAHHDHYCWCYFIVVDLTQYAVDK